MALTIILFEGGLDLDLKHTLSQAGRAILLAVLSFALSMFLVYYAATLGLEAKGHQGLAMAAALVKVESIVSAA